ncbi:ABC transporter ATP-binding protein [Puia sp. P3]|uniref:ABC transporter ATP-binding protein n=1 Tax=Puia sp. P3 TaxID=3423952 RepID=UPI003D671C3B
MAPVITTNKLTKRFGQFIAANALTFEVGKGEIFGFLGANGAGKTTAMRMLCGLSTPSSGTATVAGFDVYTQTEKIKQNIGYMSQKFSLYDDLTVAENIRFYAGIYGMSTQAIKAKTNQLLQELQLEKEAKTLVKALPSAGNKNSPSPSPSSTTPTSSSSTNPPAESIPSPDASSGTSSTPPRTKE